QTDIKTPRPPKAWCHARLNFSILCLESKSYPIEVFKMSLGGFLAHDDDEKLYLDGAKPKDLGGKVSNNL
ncbi:MAG: hypothetical protein OEU92_01620, partial [Alphaproteobacteria bacterium]|nr:hypothetical protein [Alphaproteobacteria bacterium]